MTTDDDYWDNKTRTVRERIEVRELRERDRKNKALVASRSYLGWGLFAVLILIFGVAKFSALLALGLVIGVIVGVVGTIGAFIAGEDYS